MLSLIKEILFSKKTDTISGKDGEMYAKACGSLSIGINVILVGVKLLCGLLSGSVSILADAFNNLTDIVVAGMNYLGILIAGIGAGKTHPFGHGRFEWVMGLFSGMIITVMGAKMGMDSIHEIAHPGEVVCSPVVCFILLCSIGAKGIMFLYNKRIGNRINSMTLKATACDSKNDMISTAMILFAMITQRVVHIKIDGLCGLIVSGIILYGGLKIMTEGIERILGECPEESVMKEIREIAMGYPSVTGISELAIHDYGLGNYFVCMHIQGKGQEQIVRLSNVAHEIESKLQEEFGCNSAIQIDIIS